MKNRFERKAISPGVSVDLWVSKWVRGIAGNRPGLQTQGNLGHVWLLRLLREGRWEGREAAKA